MRTIILLMKYVQGSYSISHLWIPLLSVQHGCLLSAVNNILALSFTWSCENHVMADVVQWISRYQMLSGSMVERPLLLSRFRFSSKDFRIKLYLFMAISTFKQHKHKSITTTVIKNKQHVWKVWLQFVF